MNTLTHGHFQKWMETYGKASAENDPQASTDLFARNAAYYETPFAEPMPGREAIYEYWNKGAQTLKEKASIFEILSLQDQCGIALAIEIHRYRIGQTPRVGLYICRRVQ